MRNFKSSDSIEGVISALLLVVLLSFVGWKAWQAPWFVDDALITMQYAKNVADGNGYSFNKGGDDFATTSTLHTLVSSLCFLFTDSDQTALRIVKIIEFVLLIVGLILFYFLFRGAGVSRIAGVSFIVLLVTNNNSFVYLLSGMELAWYLFAIPLTLYFSHTGRKKLVGLMGGILYLIRPESILLVIAIGVLDLWSGWRQGKRDGLIARIRSWIFPAIITLSVVTPFWLYFAVTKGSIFPESGEVKLLTARNWGLYHTYFDELLKTIGWWLIFVVVGLFSEKLRTSTFLSLIVFVIVDIALYTWMGMPRSPWYYLPFHIGIFCLISLGIDILYKAFSYSTTGKAMLWTALLTAYFVIPGQGAKQLARNGAEIKGRVDKMTSINQAVGEWIAKNTPADISLAVPNIGYVGFYAKRRIVDLVGLVNPDIARHHYKDNTYWYRVYKPDYVANRLRYSINLLDNNNYEPIKVFGHLKHGGDRFVVFRRITDLDEKNQSQEVPLYLNNWSFLESGVNGYLSKTGGRLEALSIRPSDRYFGLRLTLKTNISLGKGRILEMRITLPKEPLKALIVKLRGGIVEKRYFAEFHETNRLVPGKERLLLFARENTTKSSHHVDWQKFDTLDVVFVPKSKDAAVSSFSISEIMIYAGEKGG
jgi:hypothetical protein